MSNLICRFVLLMWLKNRILNARLSVTNILTLDISKGYRWQLF